MKLIKPSYTILTPINRIEILKLLELAGRTCWKSENKITEDSCSKFVKNILGKNHLSVIEHVSIGVRLIVDRGFLAEITRHRLASYSVESTRYVRYKDLVSVTYIIPPWVNIEPGEYTSIKDINCTPDYMWYESLRIAERYYSCLLENGWTPQQARSVLPNSLKTEIVMTANLREWKHVFDLRCDKSAHPQMREIMIPLREDFHRELPEIFTKGD